MADDPILSPPLGALTPDELGVAPAPPAPVAPTPGPSVYQNPRQKLLQDAILFMATMTRNPGLLHGLNVGQQQLEQARLLHEQQVQQQFRQQQAEYDRKAQAIQADTERRRSLYGTNLPKLKAQVDKATSQDEYDAAIHAWAQGLQSQSLRVTPQRLMQDVGPFRGAAKVADEALDDYEKKPAIQQTFQQNPQLLWHATIQVGGRPMLYKDAWTLSGRPVDAQGQPVMTPTMGPAQMKSVLVDGKPAEAMFDPRARKWFVGTQEIAPERIKPMPTAAEMSGSEAVDPIAVNNAAKSILEKRMAPSQLSLVGGMGKAGVRFKQAVLGAVLAQDPQFDLAAAESNYQYGKSAGTQTTVRLIDNIEHSLPILEKASDDFTRSGVRVINKAILATKNQFGSTSVAAFETARLGLADEIAKILSGGGTGNTTSDAKLKQANDLLAADMTPAQLRTVTRSVRELLQTRRQSLTKGTYLEKRESAAPEPTTASTGPPIGERRLFNGQLGEWDGKGWKPVR